MGEFPSNASESCKFAGLSSGPFDFAFNLEVAVCMEVFWVNKRIATVGIGGTGHEDRPETR